MRKKIFFGICAAMAAVLNMTGAGHAGKSRYDENYFSNRPVVDQDGKALRFYDDLIKDKIVVISFIFTNCTQICPVNTALLAEVQRTLGDAVGRDIFFISLTVDPKNDTPERLKAYAEAFGAKPGWSFVTGAPDDMKAITRSLGDRTEALNSHLNEVVLGNDRTGEWARNSTMGKLETLILEVRAMDPKWRDQVSPLAADPSFTRAPPTGLVASQTGQALFKKVCSGCHTIGVGDRIGPDLLGVTTRRSHDWIAKFVMDPLSMMMQKDPTALELAKKFPTVRMPFLGLSRVDAADLITYLEAQTARISDARVPAAGTPHAEHASDQATDHGSGSPHH